ncbi:hypothetical protein BV898_03427 [Hypsibius exemplaris]|uniref:Uncharacterized protein n=1 Tax=Hypsibius exemplaris TaxID=2072580 RepID=A0A1W0X5K3_HYPEX|nr:hypothetical protein BV898_03427 [Hypsibius exemplaris]
MQDEERRGGYQGGVTKVMNNFLFLTLVVVGVAVMTLASTENGLLRHKDTSRVASKVAAQKGHAAAVRQPATKRVPTSTAQTRTKPIGRGGFQPAPGGPVTATVPTIPPITPGPGAPTTTTGKQV